MEVRSATSSEIEELIDTYRLKKSDFFPAIGLATYWARCQRKEKEMRGKLVSRQVLGKSAGGAGIITMYNLGLAGASYLALAISSECLNIVLSTRLYV